jgi:hypothetical protein
MATLAPPLINGRAYDFASVTVIIGGVPFRGISAINYTEEQEKANNFGTGNSPVSRGRGAVDTSVSIDISMSEIEKIRDSAPEGRLLNLEPFDIIVTHGNPQRPVSHTIKNCEFTNDGVEGSQGDTDLTKSFELVASHVKYR